MFKSKRAGESPRNQITIVASGTRLTGTVEFSGHLDVEGEIVGDVKAHGQDASHQVRVLNGGRINGDIHAPIVIIDGDIEGNVYSSQRIQVAAGAVVTGDLHYQALEMSRGAQINGGLLYSGETAGDEPGLPSQPVNAEEGDHPAGSF